MVYLEDSYGSADLGFAQPVHASRCVIFTPSSLEEPVHHSPPRMMMRQRDGSTAAARVVSQTSTGLVRLAFESKPEYDGLYDLTAEEYWWEG